MLVRPSEALGETRLQIGLVSTERRLRTERRPLRIGLLTTACLTAETTLSTRSLRVKFCFFIPLEPPPGGVP